MRLILIDNYDSFTYNLVHCFGQFGAVPEVFRHDQITIAELGTLRPSHLIVSPGPASPDEAGISCDAIRAFAGVIPILGVCLGHQCIGQVFGGKVIQSTEPVHGKCAPVHHDSTGVFAGLPNPFEAMRYHSLILSPSSIPSCLHVTAQTDSGEIMAVRHREYSIEGVQFHPESILTPEGAKLLSNFLSYRGGHWSR